MQAAIYMNLKTLAAVVLAAAFAASCAAVTGEEKLPFDDTKDFLEAGKAEAWSTQDAPSLFNASLEYKLAALPQVGEATNIPWAGNYWPTYEDNINKRWDGPQSDSPAKKFEKAFALSGVEAAVSRYHGIDSNSGRKECAQDSECDSKIGEGCAKREGQAKGRCIPTWWGICHAWAPAAILVPEPKFPVTHNGVTFKVQDLKALVSLAHEKVQTKFVSLRCNKDAHESANDITFDEYGRPSNADSECRDTNPGTFHVLLTNYLGIMKSSFVYDRTYDDEVWNQPLRGYKILQQKEVVATEANRIIGVTSIGGATVKKTGTVAKSAWSHQGSFPVSAGQALKVRMSGTGDADLYVKFGAAPTSAAYDCRPYGSDSNETCELTVPAGATAVFVSVYGYADANTFEVNVTSGGSVPVAYQFNAAAAKFFHVKSEVYYITESNASTDGHLGARIGDYTRTDPLEYILEVDAAGKVIGGEWVGASKTKHPDFLWLPVMATTTTVAGGLISYARVKDLLDRSLVAPGTPTTGTEKTVTYNGTAIKSTWKHYGPFQVADGKTLTATMTGTLAGAAGDVDLYVRKGLSPTTATYECRPYKPTANESCAVVGPGAVYVSVRGDSGTLNAPYTLVVKYTEGTGGTVTPPAGTFTHLNITGSVALGEEKVFTVAVPAGKKLVIKTTAPQDVDLYIQMNAAPTQSAYLARGYTDTGDESISYTTTSSGTLHVMVHGYAASTFTLKTSDF